MNFNNLKICICILLFNITALSALTFSKDTLSAYDGRFWNSGYGDDSLIISNTSSLSKVIDSIFIQIDTSKYDQFQIGWVEKSMDSTAIRVFNSNNYSSIGNCFRVGTSLNKYNHFPETDKIRIKPHQKITMQSPYFSTFCSEVGVLVECIGGRCYPLNAIIRESKFKGRIIFFTDQRPDTLHLACEFTDYITSVKSHAITNQKSIAPNRSFYVNILGQKIPSLTKLDAFHSLRLRAGESSKLNLK